MKNLVVDIPVKNISVTGLNDRKEFDESSLNQLADSIRENGLLQNLVVRPNPKNDQLYDLVAGERRLKASTIIGLKTLPCLVRNLNDKEFQQIMLIENLQREDLHPLEEAISLKRLLNGKNNFKHVALKLGKSVKHVKQINSLNNLDPEVMTLFKNDPSFLLAHALILASFSPDTQVKAVESIVVSHGDFTYFDSPFELKRWINTHVLMHLKDAIFDIKSKSLDKKAGSCNDCQKQTGSDADLFSSLSEDSCCLDRSCFLNKSKIQTSLNNNVLLKEFNTKIKQCVKITSNWYSYKDEVLAREYWKDAHEQRCPDTILGVIQDEFFGSIVKPVCINKKCSVHFAQRISNRVSEVPENETKSESFARKMKKRKAKNLTADHHAARLDSLEAIFKSESDIINSWELAYVLKSLCSSSFGHAVSVAKYMGIIEQDANLYHWDMNKIIRPIVKLGDKAMFMFIRRLIAQQVLNPDDKFIDSVRKDSNYLVQQAESLNIKFFSFLKSRKDLRKDDYAAQNKRLGEIKTKEKAKAKQIAEYMNKAQELYPELFDVLSAKNREKQLATFSLDILSRMAFRLGLKRKKDADIPYYITLINQGITELEANHAS